MCWIEISFSNHSSRHLELRYRVTWTMENLSARATQSDAGVIFGKISPEIASQNGARSRRLLRKYIYFICQLEIYFPSCEYVFYHLGLYLTSYLNKFRARIRHSRIKLSSKQLKFHPLLFPFCSVRVFFFFTLDLRLCVVSIGTSGVRAEAMRHYWIQRY